ncbi:MAG: NAD-dependent epimerase/dehydratase family protein [Actinomycetota bacterium]
MTTVFVTGGSGFLGNRLIRTLRARGDAVVGLARSDESARKVELVGAEVARGDLGDPAMLREAMRGADVVFHAAAKVDEWGRPAEFERVNVEGTKNVLWAARRAHVSRLIHVGTEAVLLDGRPLVDADETTPYARRPPGWYARTKRDAEQEVLAANDPDLETVVVRPRFVWGPGDTTLLPGFADAVRTGRFRWVGDGRNLTSTTHVRNAVHGLLLAADRGRPGEVYFVTDGPPIVFREMVTRLLATAGLTPPERRIGRGAARLLAAVSEGTWALVNAKRPPPVTRGAVVVLSQTCTLSDAKARRELGYGPVIDVDRGLDELEQLHANRRQRERGGHTAVD